MNLKHKFITSALDQAPFAFAVVNLNGQICDCNNFIADKWGYSHEEFTQLHIKNITHPDDVPEGQELFDKLISGKLPFYNLEKRYLTKKGEIFWGQLYATLEKSTEGQSYVVGIVQDLTKTKVLQDSLEEKQKNLHAILENTPDLVWSLDKNYVITTLNSNIKNIVKEFTGSQLNVGDSGLSKVLPSKEMRIWKSFYDRALAGETFKAEYQPVPDNPLVVDVYFKPLKKYGEVTGINVIARNITEDRKKELEAIRQEQFLLQIQKEAKIGAWRWNHDKDLLEYTDTLLEIFDFDEDEVNPYSLLKKVQQSVHPDDKAFHDEQMEKIFKEKKPFAIDYRIVSQQGKIKHIRIIGGESVPDPHSGDLIQLGSTQDITNFKLQENRLLENRERVKALINNSTIGVAIVSFEGYIFRANDSLARMFGYTRKELIGKNIYEITHPDHRQNTKKYIQELHNGDLGAFYTEKKYLKKNGETAWFFLNISVVRDDKKQPMYLIGQLQDITERKNEEEKIKKVVEEQTAQLKAVNKELEAFSYSVSHDLRSPLRSIHGFSKALIEDFTDNLDEQGLTYLNKIYNSSIRMDEMIDNLLYLSRITNSKYKREHINLSLLAENLISDSSINEQYPDTKINIEKDLFCLGDEKLLKILIENLISNACKYSSKEEAPEVSFGKTLIDNKSVFYIKDNGVGFNMIHAEELFNPFHRLHKKEQFEGSGIGLATVKRIIKRHNGKIWAESEVGKGAIFYFKL